VSGTRSVWLVSLPVLLAGCLAAHVAAYLVAEPSHHDHGYLARLPLFAAGGLILLVAAALHHGVRGSVGERPAPELFATLPPVAFSVQEHLERLLHGGDLPLSVVLTPTFLVGLALQLPFALIAWALARAVLRAAETLAALLRPARPRHPGLRVRRPLARCGLRIRPLALGVAGRGPPFCV
jgi:hypothetical protein